MRTIGFQIYMAWHFEFYTTGSSLLNVSPVWGENVVIVMPAVFIATPFTPISRLANPRLCHGLEIDEDGLEQAFTMAWDAIKL